LAPRNVPWKGSGARFSCSTLSSPPLKIEKSSILFTICIDFCGERLQGLGVVSAEILQFYFGEKG
jgi:hypothetical protein